MAVPKRKVSKPRKRKRRAHHGLATPGMSKCPQCGARKAPHRACASCGSYQGRSVIEVDEE
jgi:large subunit ribosomal protein L32